MLPGFEFIPIIHEDSDFNEADFDQEITTLNRHHNNNDDCVNNKHNQESIREERVCRRDGVGVDSESVSGESISSDGMGGGGRGSPPAATPPNNSSSGKTNGKPLASAAGNGSGRRRRGGGKNSSGGGCGGEGGSRGQIKPVQRNAANARERARMRVLSKAFSKLKTSLPWVPPDTKLSKLDTLRLASSYISHLKRILDDDALDGQLVHPINLTWPFAITNKPPCNENMENSVCDVMDTTGSSSNHNTDEEGWCT